MTPKEQYYRYGESLGISINDLQRLKMLADNCQKDMADEIKSLINSYNSKIDELYKHYKGGYSLLTLEQINTIEYLMVLNVIPDLKKLINKQD